jgi:hypothetical protein
MKKYKMEKTESQDMEKRRKCQFFCNKSLIKIKEHKKVFGKTK